MKPENYISVERPGKSATVDFLDADISVTLTLVDGKIEIRAAKEDGGGYFREQDFTFDPETIG